MLCRSWPNIRSIAICCPRWCAVCAMRRVITQARERGTSKNLVSPLPPSFVFGAQYLEPFAAVLRITPDKFEPRLGFWQRWRVYIDAKHRAHPEILAHALMHHLFMHASSARIAGSRTQRHLFIAKLTPCAHHFDPLGLVRLYKKVVMHCKPPKRRRIESVSNFSTKYFSTRNAELSPARFLPNRTVVPIRYVRQTESLERNKLGTRNLDVGARTVRAAAFTRSAHPACNHPGDKMTNRLGVLFLLVGAVCRHPCICRRQRHHEVQRDSGSHLGLRFAQQF